MTADSIEHGAQAEHLEGSAPPHAYCTPFEMMLLDYLEIAPRRDHSGRRDGRRAAMLAALDNRATYSQIRDWRQGWRKPPAWALQLLENKIARRAARLSRSITAPRAI